MDNLTNKVFGNLTVKHLAGSDKHGKRVWHCICSCGNIRKTTTGELNSGKAVSCGCRRRTTNTRLLSTHGKTYTPEYVAWQHLKARCNNPNDIQYINYGGRGIQVCDKWINSFEAFYSDMGTKPIGKYSIDRRNNNGKYSPDNCYWATDIEQANNKRVRKTSKTGISGVTRKGFKWQARISKNAKEYSLGIFADFFEACCARKSAEIHR